MKRSMIRAGVLVTLAACGSSTGPNTQTLQNDAYTSGTLTFAAGFAAGEAAAARFGPLTTSLTIKRVRFLFGGAAPVDSVNSSSPMTPALTIPAASSTRTSTR